MANRLYSPACDDAARRAPDIGAIAPSQLTMPMAWASGPRELFVASRCAWLECCCDSDLNQWVTHINFPSTSFVGMFAVELRADGDR